VRTSNDLPPRSNNAEERDTVAAVQDDDNNNDDDDDDDDAAPPGIVLRTDYSAGSDDAWAAFCSALRDAEREFLSDQDQDQGGSTSVSLSAPDDDGDVEMAPAPHPPVAVPAAAQDAAASGDDEEEEEEEEELALFSLVADSTRFDGISNLRALRLLFDVSVRAAPAQPSSSSLSTGSSSAHHHQKQKEHRHRHAHRLTRQRGLQETYDTRGRTLWIFDARSRIDGCARLVSEAGDIATSVVDRSLSWPPAFLTVMVIFFCRGDSWRARTTHMAELQASLAARALRIHFGGLDRWDYAERQRNIREADAGCASAL